MPGYQQTSAFQHQARVDQEFVLINKPSIQSFIQLEY